MNRNRVGRPVLMAVLATAAGWLVRWLRRRHAQAIVTAARKDKPPRGRNAGPRKTRSQKANRNR